MNIYIDTVSPEHIRAADRLCGIDGVTTNPSIVDETDHRYRDVVETAAETTDGPVLAQVLAEDADGMVPTPSDGSTTTSPGYRSAHPDDCSVLVNRAM